MKEVIATHLFFAIQTKEQQDLAKEWLKEGKIFLKNGENSLARSEAILKLNDLDKKNLILSVCKSSNTDKAEKEELFK